MLNQSTTVYNICVHYLHHDARGNQRVEFTNFESTDPHPAKNPATGDIYWTTTSNEIRGFNPNSYVRYISTPKKEK